MSPTKRGVNLRIDRIRVFFWGFEGLRGSRVEERKTCGCREREGGSTRADEYLALVEANRVWVDIDLDAFSRNLQAIRRKAGPGVRLMLVVKADAYGHGAVAIAHHAVRCGISALGVGTSAEALELRQAGIRLPILVLGTIVEEEAASALRHDIQIGLHASDRCKTLQTLACQLGVTARVHLNVDTGMGRLGVLPSRALELLREVHAASNLELAGVMTHISATEGALAPSTQKQVRSFESVLTAARKESLLSGWIHAANSSALFTGLSPLYDTVRPGISAYGILPDQIPGSEELQPVMSLHSQVIFLKDLPAGSAIGYGSTWRARQATRIATLPVGYDDGLPWRVSNRAEVLIHGQRAPLIGRVSMDYTTIDVGHIPNVRVGDRATLFGAQGDARISVEKVARTAETIPYEITCGISRRVARIYSGGEELETPTQPSPEERTAPHRAPASGLAD